MIRDKTTAGKTRLRTEDGALSRGISRFNAKKPCLSDGNLNEVYESLCFADICTRILAEYT